MSRLDKERQKRIEPKRIEHGLKKLKELNLKIIEYDENVIKFIYQNEIIFYYPYSGWHTGKTIKDGRGLKQLLKQLKPTK